MKRNKRVKNNSYIKIQENVFIFEKDLFVLIEF